MKKYPILSIGTIIFFFGLLIVSNVWLNPEKKEEKKVDVPKVRVPEPLEPLVPKVNTPEVIPEPQVPEISVQEKKAQFNATIIPAVNKVYRELMRQYQEVSESIQAGDDIDKFATLRKEYKVTNNDELLMALKPHPLSIAVAQAAIESSWATSRFFKEANNVFGIWSYNKNEARIAAGEKRGEQTIWVKKYDSVEASIRDYYRTLARGDAYKEFRRLKMETNDPYELVKKLDFYSEKREEYGKKLSTIIRFNKFDAYDQQQITL